MNADQHGSEVQECLKALALYSDFFHTPKGAFQAGLASKLGSRIAPVVLASELFIRFWMRHFMGEEYKS
jgi:hypothetical protein